MPEIFVSFRENKSAFSLRKKDKTSIVSLSKFALMDIICSSLGAHAPLFTSSFQSSLVSITSNFVSAMGS